MRNRPGTEFARAIGKAKLEEMRMAAYARRQNAIEFNGDDLLGLAWVFQLAAKECRREGMLEMAGKLDACAADFRESK